MGHEMQLASLVLHAWKKNPNVRKVDLTFWHCTQDDPQRYLPLTEEQIASAKRLIREHVPSDYYSIFPEERQVGWARRIEQFRHYLELLSQRAKNRTDECYIVFDRRGSRYGVENAPPHIVRKLQPEVNKKAGAESTACGAAVSESEKAKPKLLEKASTAAKTTKPTGGIVIVGTTYPEEHSSENLSTCFIQVTFTPRSFWMDIPESVLAKPETRGCWRKEPDFYFGVKERQKAHPDRTVDDLNPLRSVYDHGDEQIAAENIAYIFLDLWNLPVDVRFYVKAGTFDGANTWEDWLPIT